MMRELKELSVQEVPNRPDYEWVRAIAVVAVDPDLSANARTTDLELAQRDNEGKVVFDADVRILRPSQTDNGRLLCVVPNRGLLMGVPMSADVPPEAILDEPPHVGDGHLLEQGWTILWCGWQWDVVDGLGLRAPVVDVGAGWLRAEWRPDLAAPSLPLSDAGMFTFTPYPTADLQDPEAVLTVRTSPDGPSRPIPRDRWRFAGDSQIALDGDFQPFHWYELVYRTRHCPVVGAGLLAFRDVAAGVGAAFEHRFAYGVSQSGRFLRQLLWEGMNLDEHGRQVFDGVFTHIASSRRGEFNHRYARPSYTHTLGFSNLPPFTTPDLLGRQRELGGSPKVIETNSSWEYWRGDGALLHADPVTGQDLPDDDDVRSYLLAGHDHLGSTAYKLSLPVANPVHQLDPQPVLRALFLALEQWVTAGTAPPPSQVPRLAEGTAVPREAVLERFSDAEVPDAEHLNVARRLDLGPASDRGLGRWPLVHGERLVALVADVDDDRNERCGIRLPELTAPVAAYTGWNPRRPVPGLPTVLYEFTGSRLTLPPGRPSVLERYPSEVSYTGAARAAAEQLAREGLLLAVDVERTVASAVAVYLQAVGTSRNPVSR